MTKKTALLIFIALVILAPITLYAHQPSMEVISTDPPSPAVLEPGQRFYVKFRYNAGHAESIHTWVRPDGNQKGCKSHPCRSIRDKQGVYEGWFFFDDNAAEVKSIKLLMKDDKDKHGYIFEGTAPVDIKWKAPKSDGPRGYAVPNTSVKIISTYPQLPAVLKPGEQFKIKFRFDAGNAKSITIHTWPNNEKNNCFPDGRKFNFNGHDNSVGQYQYSLLNDKPASIRNVKFRMTDNYTDRTILEYTFPVDVTWQELETDSGQSRTASSISCKTNSCQAAALPKTQSTQFDSIHAQIAKKYAKKYEGVWIYNLKDSKTNKAIIIQGKRDWQGGLKFSFLHQDIYPEPVFIKCSIDQYRANIYFKLKNNRPVMYNLNRNEQTLNGTVYSSWKDEQKVTLRKLTLPQAIEVIKNDYSRINQLKKTINKTRSKAKREKNKYRKNIKKVENKLKKSREQLSESNEKRVKLEREYYRVIKEDREEVEAFREEHKKLTAQLRNIEKSNRKSEKRYNRIIEQLRDRISELELNLKTAAKEISELDDN